MSKAVDYMAQRRAMNRDLTQRLTLSCFWYQDPVKILETLEDRKEIESVYAITRSSLEGVTKPLFVNY